MKKDKMNRFARLLKICPRLHYEKQQGCNSAGAQISGAADRSEGAKRVSADGCGARTSARGTILGSFTTPNEGQEALAIRREILFR